MKKIMLSSLVIGLITISACNNSDNSSRESMSKMSVDTAKNTPVDNSQIAELVHTFKDVDSKLASSIKTVLDHYFHIKNALVRNDGSDAANGGKAMAEEIGKIDKSLFTTEQKQVYDDIKDDLKENAEHIGKSGGDIAHQREHFSMMSQDIYDLVKAFGAGRVVYHDHCPMANSNKGAMWLSEMREIINPYFGGKMNDCVKIPESIK